MDIEKLIERLKAKDFERDYDCTPFECGVFGLLDDAATALSTLQAENKRLQEMYQKEKAVCHATQAELEQVKRERDAAIHDMRQFSIDWWESANGFPCMYCKYQLSDGNCKWKMEHKGEKDGCFARQFKWRGPEEG
mgnify:CR=1 FL=1